MHLIPDTLDLSQWEKDPVDAPRVRPASLYLPDVLARFDGATLGGRTLPWARTHDQIRLRAGEVTIWNGISGHGKSLLLNQVCAGLMEQGERICIASMEMSPVATLVRLCRQVGGVNRPTEELIRAISRWTDGKLWIYDQQGMVAPDRMIAIARYTADKLKITHVVIDSLMKCGLSPDDYAGQRRFVDALCAHARDTGQHIHLVTHARKGSSEAGIPDKFDVAGSSDITNQADNVLTVWRNKPKEEAIRENRCEDETAPDCLLICSKQRHGEWEGRIGLYFEPASLQYVTQQGRAIPCRLALEPESPSPDAEESFRSWAP